MQGQYEDLKELQSLLQEWASKPDRPAVPLDSLALGSPAAKYLLKQAFPEDVSQLEFHEWYVVGWHERNQGSHRLGQELHLRSWRIVISGLYSPFHETVRF